MSQTMRGIFEVAAFTRLPEYMQDGLRAYVESHRPAGHFLTAVLSNDLRGAVARADAANTAALADYVVWLDNYAPAACWGSRDAVFAWLTTDEEER